MSGGNNDNVGPKRQQQQEEPINKSSQAERLEANLHSAANEGKAELVRLLLRCGADVNAQDGQVSFWSTDVFCLGALDWAPSEIRCVGSSDLLAAPPTVIVASATAAVAGH